MTYKKLILPLLVISLSGCSEFLKGEADRRKMINTFKILKAVLGS